MPPESAAETSDGVSRSEAGASPTQLNGAEATTASASRAPTGSPPDGATSSAATLSISGDWAAQLTGKVEDVVSVVRDKAVEPVLTAVRYLIFGLMALSVATFLAVLFTVFALRVLDSEVPVFRTRVWASYLVVAGIFWGAGLLLSRKRHPRN